MKTLINTSLPQNCTGKYNDSDYLTSYTVFVWVLSGLIILANVLLITVILKSAGLRNQVCLLYFMLHNHENAWNLIFRSESCFRLAHVKNNDDNN